MRLLWNCVSSLVRYFEEIVSAALLIAMAVVTGLQIVCRYILNAPLVWPEELEGFLLIWFMLSAAAVATKRNAHTQIEFLSKRLHATGKAILIGVTFVLTSTMLWILIITGYIVAMQTNFPTATLPFSWTTVYMAVPISCLLIFVRLVQLVVIKRTGGK